MFFQCAFVATYSFFQNADAICSGILPQTLTTSDAQRYRGIIYSRLRSQMTSTKCASYLCLQPTGDLSWALCDSCMLWHHAVCEGLQMPIADIWYCKICLAARNA